MGKLICERKEVYGKVLWYPVEPAGVAQAVCSLVGKKTIDEADMACLFALGFEVEAKRVNAPEYGKLYALTGGNGQKCIAAGNTWAESEVVDRNGY